MARGDLLLISIAWKCQLINFVNHMKPFIDQWNIIKEIIDRSDTETFCVLYR